MIKLTRKQLLIKRIFDFTLALVGLTVFSWVIIISWVLATFDTKSNGFFIQTRVGRHGKLFKVIKIKTMKADSKVSTTVTTSEDSRITKVGRLLRKTKIDELPQLFNVLLGQMSFVGPRPDVPGFADKLKGEERAILSIWPGITGPATIKYKDEEHILASQQEPERYNSEVIFPDKVRININYIEQWSLINDLKYIFQTVVS